MKDRQVFVVMSSDREVGNRVCGKKLAVHQSCHPLDVLFVQTTKFSCADGPEVFDVLGYEQCTPLDAL